ncbi:MAG: MMPL family transporter [Geobacteraceae bacterium]|nr:MMPL family transporter [Geobacteraceae bacterium]
MEFVNKLTSATQKLISSHLSWIHRITLGRPKTVFAVSLLLLALSALSISRTHFESDIFKLFPNKGPLALFLDSLEWTGSARNVFFLLEGNRDKLASEAETFAGKLEKLRIDGAPAFEKVQYRIFDPAEVKPFAKFLGYATTRPQLFLLPEDAQKYAGMLAPEAVSRSLQTARAELAMPGTVQEVIAADPLYLRNLILPRLKKSSQALDMDPSSPYFLSRDGKLLIIIAEPAQPVTNMAFARKLMTDINEARQGASVKITCTGAHLSAVTDEAAMKKEIAGCILSSLVVVLALFYLTYRRFLPTVLIPVILVSGVILALGTAGLALTSVHIISFAFTALIIGLGTDYSIHIYDRFYSERVKGTTTDEALRLAVVDTGHGVFTAATTTALPFLALMFADVRALSELGLLVGLGVIFSLYATYFLLPPLLLFMERRFPQAHYQPLPSFSLGGVWELAEKYGRPVIGLSFIAIAGLLVASFFIPFEGELKNLQPRNSEAFQTQEKIERHLSISPKQMLVAVDGKELRGLLERSARIEALADGYRKRGEVQSYSSIGQVLNGQEAQQTILRTLKESAPVLNAGTEVSSALELQGFAASQFLPYTEGIAALPHANPIPLIEGIERLKASPFRGIVDRHLMSAQGIYHNLIYLNYRGTEFNQRQFLKDLHAIDREARATSVDLVSGQLTESVKKSFVIAFILGGGIVLFLLLAHFDSLSGIFFSLYPVGAGVIAMLGIMSIIGMGLNFMNAMVLVTIIGMGSDYGLHIAHRIKGVWGEERKEQFVQAGRAVLLSALTTIAGFGSLAFADYRALASIGWATNFGIAATALFSLMVLPAFCRNKVLRGELPGTPASDRQC